jgi:hypothetical protein
MNFHIRSGNSIRLLAAIGSTATLLLIPSGADAATDPGVPPAGCYPHTFAEGSTGPCVTWIQRSVNYSDAFYGWHQQIRVDGNYGQPTKSAVAAFQAGCDALSGWHVSGGVVGQWTMDALETVCWDLNV